MPDGKIKNLRWWIVGFIGLATAINYLDRQTFPIALVEIRKTISVSDVQFGMVNSIFLFAYGTMYAAGGRIFDILGTRNAYMLIIIWWSLANILTGFVFGVIGFGVCRFLLGIGEGGAFPGSAKVVSEWFPAKERSLAFGIFNTGSSLGAVVAPPLIAAVIAILNWRWAFILSGLLGMLWVALWFQIYSIPNLNKFIISNEKKFISLSLNQEKIKRIANKGKIKWINLFRSKKIWGLLTIKFLTDAIWFFFIFWFPKYLQDVRGLDIKGIGAFAWIPFVFAGSGSFIGGWFSSYLLRRNYSLDISRKFPLAISAMMFPVCLFIQHASFMMTILFFCIAMLAHQSWSTIVQTLVADMFPSKIVGSVSGLMGCVGTYGAMLFSFFIGFVIEKSGYTYPFIISGLMHPVSFILLLILIRKIEFDNDIVPAHTFNINYD